MIKLLRFISFWALLFFIWHIETGCANMIPPSGGPRDSIPPKLFAALPKDSAINVTTNKITLVFDEFIDGKDIQKNLIISPYPKNSPLIDYKLRNVTIKLKDSLEANTTYSLNFGDGLKDVNEDNIAKNFKYVFSTGNTIDQNVFSGNVILAETGKIDSTLIIVLHKNLDDTAIYKNRPRYYTRVDGKGKFVFTNLPEGKFNAFVLPNDFTKKYDDSTKLFAFADSLIIINKSTKPVNFYAYEEFKRKNVTKSSSPNNDKNNKPKKEDIRLRYTTSLDNATQDILSPDLDITFNRKIKSFDSSKIILTDQSFKELKNYTVKLDTGKTKISVRNEWKEGMVLRLIIMKEAVTDTSNKTISKSDTLIIHTKSESDYGSLAIRFTNLDLSKNPVLLVMLNDKIAEAIPITQRDLFRKLYRPGEYELSVLFDTNNNKVWDTGNYKKRRQPEVVKQLNKKLSVRANWDNEIEVAL